MAVNKRKIHHILVLLKSIKTWHLLLALVLLVALSAFLLRQNNLGMIELRNLVKQSDEENGNTAQALADLQNYVAAHMNTSLGEGIFLEHTYQRDYDAKIQQAANAVNPNSEVYKQAETKCRQQYAASHSFSGYISCIQASLSTLAPGTDPLSGVKPPSQDLYKYNFVSPTISFDWAGLTVLATLLVVALLILRMAGFITLKTLLRVKSHN